VSPTRPLFSVIVPAHQAARYLPDSLEALAHSSLPRSVWELIVIDDASTDGTDIVAGQYADTVIRLAGNPHGPAYGRNRGFEFSRGHVLVFVDADVRVHRESLRQMAAEFTDDPELGGVFGAYDDSPAAPGLVSQYRNLLHHYVHREGEGDAETFWAGLGAVRRDVFAEAGMFDEWHYSRPQIEDIELGRRIRRLGHRIVLRPRILGTHLKRWTLRDVVRTDYMHRGVPWAWLLVREGRAVPERALNLQLDYRVSTGAACLAVVALVSAPLIGVREAVALAIVLVAVVGFLNLGFYRVLVSRMGLARTLAVFPVHLLHYISNGAAAVTGWLSHHLFGEPETPASVVALADTGVKTWPPRHARPRASLWTTPPGKLSRREDDAR
jgi:glycosyltransferase involved in cell wall biosynthesis